MYDEYEMSPRNEIRLPREPLRVSISANDRIVSGNSTILGHLVATFWMLH